MIRALRNNRPNILLTSISRPNRAKTEYKNKHQNIYLNSLTFGHRNKHQNINLNSYSVTKTSFVISSKHLDTETLVIKIEI